MQLDPTALEATLVEAVLPAPLAAWEGLGMGDNRARDVRVSLLRG